MRRRRVGREGVLLALALLAPACTPGGDGQPTVAELRLMELLEMRRTGDLTGIEEVFHPVAVYQDRPNQVEYQGLPEIQAFLEGFHGWATGVFLDVVALHVGDGVAVAEWVLEGTQGGPAPGLGDPAERRRFRLEGVTVVEVEQGLVVRAADYADPTPMLLELGGTLILPDGDTLRAAPPPEEVRDP